MVRHILALFFINTAESLNLRTVGSYKNLSNGLGVRMLAEDGQTLRNVFLRGFERTLRKSATR
jgi:hypothetical protein